MIQFLGAILMGVSVAILVSKDLRKMLGEKNDEEE